MTTFWKKLQSKNEPIIALAPMAGVTDSAFRQICKEFGADVVYTEMVSVEGLQYAKDKVISKAFFHKKEHPVVVQLMGADPKKFASAAQELEAMGVDGIDLNFGCPAKKITKCESGVQLMENLDLAHAIVKETINAVSIPVSCKIRISKFSKVENRDVTGLEFVKKMKDLNVSALMVHGRKYEQVHSGEVDLNAIKEIKEAFGGIVLANGGIKTPEDAKEMLEKTGADGVGIARGANGKPYIFKQIKDYLDTGEYSEPSLEEIKELIMRHVTLSFEHKEERGIMEMRKHLAWYVRGMKGASKLRAQLVRVNNPNEVNKILNRSFLKD